MRKGDLKYIGVSYNGNMDTVKSTAQAVKSLADHIELCFKHGYKTDEYYAFLESLYYDSSRITPSDFSRIAQHIAKELIYIAQSDLWFGEYDSQHRETVYMTNFGNDIDEDFLGELWYSEAYHGDLTKPDKPVKKTVKKTTKPTVKSSAKKKTTTRKVTKR